MIIILLLIIFVLICSTAFLFKELLKKFQFWESFRHSSKNQFSWNYNGDRKPGMYTIEIISRAPKRALIGVDFGNFTRLNLGYDVFGYIESKDENKILISLYLGHRPIRFNFMYSGDYESTISIGFYSGNETPHYIFPPHWWQRIGFFG